MYKRSLLAIGLVLSSAFPLTAAAQFVPDVQPRSSDDSGGDGAADGASAEYFKTYAGLDYVMGTFSTSTGSNAGTFNNTADFDMLRLRGGMRLFNLISAELQYGTSVGSDNSQANVESYVGLLLVPTATLFDTVEVSLPVGVSAIEVLQAGRSFDDTEVTYGAQVDLPLRLFAEIPDLRVGGGFTVYAAGNSSRTYGYNFGVRYDFNFADIEISNPFASWFGGGSETAQQAPAADAQ